MRYRTNSVAIAAKRTLRSSHHADGFMGTPSVISTFASVLVHEPRSMLVVDGASHFCSQRMSVDMLANGWPQRSGGLKDGTRCRGSDNDAAKRRALRTSASGEQLDMSARIEAAGPRPAGGSVHESRSARGDAPQVLRPASSSMPAATQLGTRETAKELMIMARFFFDFRSDGSVAADDEGLELLDADAAHQQAVGALIEGIRDIVLEGAKDQRFAVEVRDDLGRVLQISAVLESEFFRKQ